MTTPKIMTYSQHELQFLETTATELAWADKRRMVFIERFKEANADLNDTNLADVLNLSPNQIRDHLKAICDRLAAAGCNCGTDGKGRWKQAKAWLQCQRYPQWQQQHRPTSNLPPPSRIHLAQPARTSPSPNPMDWLCTAQRRPKNKSSEIDPTPTAATPASRYPILHVSRLAVSSAISATPQSGIEYALHPLAIYRLCSQPLPIGKSPVDTAGRGNATTD